MEIRQRIIDSCRELALKKGFRRLTVEEIATSARVTKRTVYRRFRSKDEIFAACVDDFLAAVGRQADALLNSGQDIPVIVEEILSYLVAGELLSASAHWKTYTAITPISGRKSISFVWSEFA